MRIGFVRGTFSICGNLTEMTSELTSTLYLESLKQQVGEKWAAEIRKTYNNPLSVPLHYATGSVALRDRESAITELNQPDFYSERLRQQISNVLYNHETDSNVIFYIWNRSKYNCL